MIKINVAVLLRDGLRPWHWRGIPSRKEAAVRGTVLRLLEVQGAFTAEIIIWAT